MKVHHVTLIVIDFDDLGSAGVAETIENTRFPNDSMNPSVFAIRSADIGEWDDAHPLNHAGSFSEEVERLFPSRDSVPTPASDQGPRQVDPAKVD